MASQLAVKDAGGQNKTEGQTRNDSPVRSEILVKAEPVARVEPVTKLTENIKGSVPAASVAAVPTTKMVDKQNGAEALAAYKYSGRAFEAVRTLTCRGIW
ncbi:MAG: hypothetical protein IPJ49_20095 [Candidatus Obscuribacter sp.]|nr:hypothetical protein [Candidatus Obscuribacter sp.]